MDSSPTETVADGVPRQLDPRWIVVQRIHGVIAGVLLSFASFVGLMIAWVATGRLIAGLFLLPLWALLMAALAWHLYRWPAIAYPFASYRVDADGLEIVRGVYWRTITNVPKSRV